MHTQFKLSTLKTLCQIALGCYLVLLLISTHLPPRSPLLPREVAHFDKLCHFTAYALFGALLASTWQLTSGARNARHLLFTWIAVAVFAALDEITQIPVHRDCDFWDWTADVIGAAVGLIAFVWVRKMFAARLSRRIQSDD